MDLVVQQLMQKIDDNRERAAKQREEDKKERHYQIQMLMRLVAHLVMEKHIILILQHLKIITALLLIQFNLLGVCGVLKLVLRSQGFHKQLLLLQI